MRRFRAISPLIHLACRIIFLFAALRAGAVGEHLDSLTVGEDTYKDVFVTSVTVTDLFFNHSRGLGSVKLKKLSPELQAKFHYDPAKGAAAEAQRVQSQALYTKVAEKDAQTAQAAAREMDIEDQSWSEIPPHAISATAFINQSAPTIVAEKWLNGTPDLKGKFLLVVFWSTQSAASRGSIPRLNELAHKFQDRMVVIGLSDETEAEVRRLTSQPVEFFVAIDTQKRASTAVGVQRVPHALLMDTAGIVRFEGHPGMLSYKNVETLLTRYAP